MTLPASGAISLNDVNVELYRSATTVVYLNETVVRALFEKTTPASQIAMSDGYGKYSRVPVNLTISANTADYNAFVAAGSPTDPHPHDVTVTINTGVIVYATTTATAAFRAGGAWPAGSTFTIINNGYVIGAGGAGGAGGAYGAGSAGGAGGNAIDLSGSSLSAITVNNTNGYIYGGGGGGGGGGGAGWWTGLSEWIGGGGGGGGAGNAGGAAGTTPGTYLVYTGGTLTVAPANGTAGGSSAGTGGVGATLDRSSGGESPTTAIVYSGAGGNAGGYGEAGSAGASASQDTFTYPPNLYGGGAGGGAGMAINLSGATISWSGGNNATQVKGAVS